MGMNDVLFGAVTPAARYDSAEQSARAATVTAGPGPAREPEFRERTDSRQKPETDATHPSRLEPWRHSSS
jgi:hypothetical protein